MYQDRGWGYFGGGLDADDARSPYLTEHNGNKIAFIGCNPVGPNSVWAKEGHAGAAQCDFDYLTKKIRELKEQGYIVIATFQHEELTKQDGAEAVLMYAEKISGDFQAFGGAGGRHCQGLMHIPDGI
jgi:poly-gamma-glutamate synthesis protein (capsule biosynthesis protein)